jgi:hypothetical protein
MCRFASPTPSALGVSHSLSDFSRPSLVALFRATSAHRISAFRAFSSQPAVTPLDARCSHAVSASSGFARASSSSSVAPTDGCSDATSRSSDRECLVRPSNPASEPQHQLVSRLTEVSKESSERLKPPTERMRGLAQRRFPVREWSFGVPFCRREPTTTERCSDRKSVLERSQLNRRPSRCSLDLSPFEVCQSSRWAFALPSCACSALSRHTLRCIASWLRSVSGCQSDWT